VETGGHVVTTPDLEALSLAWEAKTGHDSIDTIERIYRRTRSRKGYQCIHPKCRTTRRNAEDMWRHVHTAHGTNNLPPADFTPEPRP
jgi:hypothetical protein